MVYQSIGLSNLSDPPNLFLYPIDPLHPLHLLAHHPPGPPGPPSPPSPPFRLLYTYPTRLSLTSSNPSPPPNLPPLSPSSSSCFSSSPHSPLPSPVTDPPPLPHTPTHLPCPTPPQLPRPTPPHLGRLTPPSPSKQAPHTLLRRPRRRGRGLRRYLRRLRRWSRLAPGCTRRLFLLLRRLIDAGRRLRCNRRLVLGGRPHRKINSFRRHLQISQRFQRRRILWLITLLGALLRWGCRFRRRRHIFLWPALCVLRAGREAFLRAGRAGPRLPVERFLGRSAGRGRRVGGGGESGGGAG